MKPSGLDYVWLSLVAEYLNDCSVFGKGSDTAEKFILKTQQHDALRYDDAAQARLSNP